MLFKRFFLLSCKLEQALSSLPKRGSKYKVAFSAQVVDHLTAIPAKKRVQPLYKLYSRVPIVGQFIAAVKIRNDGEIVHS